MSRLFVRISTAFGAIAWPAITAGAATTATAPLQEPSPIALTTAFSGLLVTLLMLRGKRPHEKNW